MGSVDDERRVRLWDIDEMISNHGLDAPDLAPPVKNLVTWNIDSIGASVVDEVSGTIIFGSLTGMIDALDVCSGAVRWRQLGCVSDLVEILRRRPPSVLR